MVLALGIWGGHQSLGDRSGILVKKGRYLPIWG